jgi:hypothetical protein
MESAARATSVTGASTKSARVNKACGMTAVAKGTAVLAYVARVGGQSRASGMHHRLQVNHGRRPDWRVRLSAMHSVHFESMRLCG